MRQADFFDTRVIMNNRDDQEVMKPLEVAEYLRIGKNKVYEMLNNGDLAGFRIGNTWCVPKEGVNIFIRQRAGLI